MKRRKVDKLELNKFVAYHSIHILQSSNSTRLKYIIIDNKQIGGKLVSELRVVTDDPNSNEDKDVEYRGNSFKDAVKVYNSILSYP